MTPKNRATLGPTELRAAIALRDHGPSRVSALVPFVWPSLKPSGSLTRGAAAILGRFKFHGWAAIDEGGVCTITSEGRRLIEEVEQREAASVVPLVNGEVPEGARVCTLCGKCRPLEHFIRREGTKVRYRKTCRWCKLESVAANREKQRAARDSDAQWVRATKDRIIAEAMRLVRAARVARRTAMFRGREGIAAYRELGEALVFFRSHQDPATNEADATAEAEPCTCPSWPCPRHVQDDADPRDTEYGKQHKNRRQAA